MSGGGKAGRRRECGATRRRQAGNGSTQSSTCCAVGQATVCCGSAASGARAGPPAARRLPPPPPAAAQGLLRPAAHPPGHGSYCCRDPGLRGRRGARGQAAASAGGSHRALPGGTVRRQRTLKTVFASRNVVSDAGRLGSRLSSLAARAPGLGCSRPFWGIGRTVQPVRRTWGPRWVGVESTDRAAAPPSRLGARCKPANRFATPDDPPQVLDGHSGLSAGPMQVLRWPSPKVEWRRSNRPSHIVSCTSRPRSNGSDCDSRLAVNPSSCCRLPCSTRG